jgi:hypothetical protein
MRGLAVFLGTVCWNKYWYYTCITFSFSLHKDHTFNILTMKTEKQYYMLVMILLLSPPTWVWSEMNIVLFNCQDTDLYAKNISWWNEFSVLAWTVKLLPKKHTQTSISHARPFASTFQRPVYGLVGNWRSTVLCNCIHYIAINR